MPEDHVQRRLPAILVADVVGYSRMMGEDEIGTLELLKWLRTEFLHPKTEELGGLDDDFRQRILGVFGDWAESLAACLRKAQHAGEPNADADRLAASFWFSWEGVIPQAKLERSLQPIEQFSDVMFHKVLTP